MADGLFLTRQTDCTGWLVTEVTADVEAATIKSYLTEGGRPDGPDQTSVCGDENVD